MATSLAVMNELGRLFKRCVQCPPTAPTCPTCPGSQVCILIPPSCDTCAHMKCVDNPIPDQSSGGPNVGAIAGGVAGGTAFVVLVVFLIWFFWIKKRREQQDRELWEEWEQDEMAYQKRSTHFSSLHDAASTRTRGSLANSILSRASNFIQIAYIPGVTNRNGSGRDSMHAPVPPIPAMYRNSPNGQPTSPLSGNGDALFFGIDDLRGSTYSAGSSIRNSKRNSNRDTRYTMQSITPSLARESIASDVYWDDATAAPMPATTAARLAPRMVSVKSASTTPSTPDSASSAGTPPEHLSDRVAEVPVMIPGQGTSTSSVRGKATQVTLGGNKSKGRFPIKQASEDSSGTSSPSSPPRHIPLKPSPLAATETLSTSPEPASEYLHLRDSLLQNIDFATPPADPQPIESPFFDATELPHSAIASSNRPNPYASMASTIGVGTRGIDRSYSTRRGGSKGKIGGLSAVMEEATKRASATESVQGEETASAGAEGPFGDENRVVE